MSGPEIGAHCSLCKLNDYLPIRCKCDNLFCRDHIAPEVHECSLQHQDPAAPHPKLQRCAAQACNKLSLESFIADSSDNTNRSPALCSGCKQAFCAQHREPSSHSCTPLPSDPAPEKNTTARALLAQHFGNTSIRIHTSQSNPKPTVAQQKLAAIKMRHKAHPADPKDEAASVPVDQRLHLKVIQAGLPTSERIFWFRKTIGTGRALDMLATRFKMVITDSKPLRLLAADVNGDSPGTPLHADQPLADQVIDGASLTLSR